jgi:hypothetical protein
VPLAAMVAMIAVAAAMAANWLRVKGRASSEPPRGEAAAEGPGAVGGSG